MMAPENSEYDDYYMLPSYPDDDSIHITEDFLSSGTVPSIEDVYSNYPYARDLHDLAEAVAVNDDLVSMSIILSMEGYLPVRWKRVWEISRDDKIRFLITNSGRYVPDSNIEIDNIVEIDSNNYLLILHDALLSYNMDMVEDILFSYGNARELIQPYNDAPLPFTTRKYLIGRGYIDVDNKERWIAEDNPSMIDSLSSADVEKVLRYDSINIFKSVVKVSDQADLIHDQILSYIVASSSNYTLIERLIPKCTYGDLVTLLYRSVHPLSAYMEVGRRGYFELLRDIGRRDLLLLTTSRDYESIGKDVHDYVEHILLPSFPIEDLVEGAIINSNIPLLSSLIDSDDIYDREGEKWMISLIYQYHMWDEGMVQSLIDIVRQK
jgi:hypothetical protein